MIRAASLILLFVLLTATSPRAQNRIDSLQTALADSRGRDRVELLIELMREEYARNPLQARAYGHEALGLLGRYSEPELRADVLYFLSGAAYFQDDRDSALVLAKQSRAVASAGVAARERERMNTARLREREGQAERFIGHIHHDRGRYVESEEAYRRALRLFEETDNPPRVAQVINDLAVLYKTQGRYSDAIVYHRRALEAFEDLKLEDESITALSGLAVVYNHTGRYGEALEAFFRVLEANERRGNEENVGGALTNIGGVYEYTREYDRALEYYEQARRIYESLGRKRRLATALTNIGSAQFHLERYADARRSYEAALILAEETQNERLLAYIHEGLGRVLEKQLEPIPARASFEKALLGFEALGERRGLAASLISLARIRKDQDGVAMAQRAVEIAREMNSHELLREGYAILSELHASRGRYADALEFYKLYKAAYDSLFNAESQSTIARLETEHRTHEQQAQIALLEQKRQVQRMWLFGLLSGLGLLGIITGLSFNRVRLRQRALSALEKAHRAEAERARLLSESAEARAHYLQAENERKAQELDAARRLQLSMLPKVVPRHPNVEIETFMRTAAEVGGDFYDFHVGADGAMTIAIGDATGHGTRAGIMVAAAKSLFSHFADEPDLAVALRHAARSVRRMALPNLYMAFALVRLRGRELELSGAGMPSALIFRSTGPSVESISLKGVPLGAPADLPYLVQKVTVEAGDTIVLMSDGFPELRNGSGIQFGYEGVVDIVREIGSEAPSRITREFEDTIQRWVGEKPIDDDITFVVMKLT